MIMLLLDDDVAVATATDDSSVHETANKKVWNKYTILRIMLFFGLNYKEEMKNDENPLKEIC